MLLKGILFFIAAFATLAMVGCTPQESYERGRVAGVEEGKRLGKEEGYQKGLAEGFERNRPGTPTRLSGMALTVYKLLIWGGVIKIFLSLGLATLVLVGSTDEAGKVVGKMLFAVLGSVTSILVVTYMHVSQVAEAVLLIPAPSSFGWQATWVAISALTMYGILEGLFRFIVGKHTPTAEGWIVFLLAGVLTYLAPVIFGLLGDVPDLTKYFAANLLSGALFGGIYYVAHGLLKGKSRVSSLILKAAPNHALHRTRQTATRR